MREIAKGIPMISGPIIPMITWVEILVSSLGVRGDPMALLVSGCTQCQISRIEAIHFIVVLRMTETMVLGLAWLTK